MSDLKILDSMQSNCAGSKKIILSQMHQDMEKYVPKRAGFLRTESYIDLQGVHYRVPYAKAQFYGFVNGHRVKNYSTPGTSRRWDLRAKAVYMTDWQKVAANALLKGGK